MLACFNRRAGGETDERIEVEVISYSGNGDKERSLGGAARLRLQVIYIESHFDEQKAS
jgi:hypothetical protein